MKQKPHYGRLWIPREFPSHTYCFLRCVKLEFVLLSEAQLSSRILQNGVNLMGRAGDHYSCGPSRPYRLESHLPHPYPGADPHRDRRTGVSVEAESSC